MTSFFLASNSSLARASSRSSLSLPRVALTQPRFLRSFHFTPLARSTQGYGSPDVSNPSPKENNQTKFPVPQDKKPHGDDAPQQTSGSGEGKDLPPANGDSKDSSGDQSKPHYVCDTEKSGAKGGSSEGEERLVKPEEKQ